MKIWHISDTHGFHFDLKIPDCDMVIFSGDCSNYREPIYNEKEVRQFLKWYSSLKIKYKIFVAGNHDTSIERGLVKRKEIEDLNIIYLENENTIIDDINIWGSPITPEFGTGWAWNRKREKIHKVWDNIPEDTNILITHGPPKGIKDLTYKRDNILDMCGCTNLMKRVMKIQPKYHLFGHIHDCRDILNAGITYISNLNTCFSNGTTVEDGKFDKGLINNGNLFEL